MQFLFGKGQNLVGFPKEWFAGVPKELYLSRRYSTAHNCYGVKSGLDQGEGFYTELLRRIDRQITTVTQVNGAREGSCAHPSHFPPPSLRLGVHAPAA